MSSNRELVDVIERSGGFTLPAGDKNVLGLSLANIAGVKEAFKAVDRELFFPDRIKHEAYKNEGVRRGFFTQLSPSTYARVLIWLDVQPGQSFLHVGSGTGYFSTLVAYLSGIEGVSHGIEIHRDLVTSANEARSSLSDVLGFFPPIVYHNANAFELDTENNMRFDRVFVSTKMNREANVFFRSMLGIGGRMVSCVDRWWIMTRRVSEISFESEKLCAVEFESSMGQLMLGTKTGRLILEDRAEEAIRQGVGVSAPAPMRGFGLEQLVCRTEDMAKQVESQPHNPVGVMNTTIGMMMPRMGGFGLGGLGRSHPHPAFGGAYGHTPYGGSGVGLGHFDHNVGHHVPFGHHLPPRSPYDGGGAGVSPYGMGGFSGQPSFPAYVSAPAAQSPYSSAPFPSAPGSSPPSSSECASAGDANVSASAAAQSIASQEVDVMISVNVSSLGDMAKRIKKHLEERGVRVWLCTESIRPGEAWRASIIQAVKTCKFFVPLLNEPWCKSGECMLETNQAIMLYGKRRQPEIVPIAWPGLNWDESLVSVLGATFNFIVFDGSDFETALASLTSRVCHVDDDDVVDLADELIAEMSLTGGSANSGGSGGPSSTSLSTPLSGVPTSPVREWSLEDVAQWLRYLRLDTFVDVFKREAIEGDDLADLSDADLAEEPLNMSRLQVRKVRKSLARLPLA